MKISIISVGDKIKDTALLTTFIVEGNVKFPLEDTENKDVDFWPDFML